MLKFELVSIKQFFDRVYVIKCGVKFHTLWSIILIIFPLDFLEIFLTKLWLKNNGARILVLICKSQLSEDKELIESYSKLAALLIKQFYIS